MIIFQGNHYLIRQSMWNLQMETKVGLLKKVMLRIYQDISRMINQLFIVEIASGGEKDGTYNRGIHAESKCPLNTKEVFDGNAYCYMAEPKDDDFSSIMDSLVSKYGTNKIYEYLKHIEENGMVEK